MFMTLERRLDPYYLWHGKGRNTFSVQYNPMTPISTVPIRPATVSVSVWSADFLFAVA